MRDFMDLEMNLVGLEMDFVGLEMGFMDLEIDIVDLEADFVGLEMGFRNLEIDIMDSEADFVGLEMGFRNLEMNFVDLETYFMGLGIDFMDGNHLGYFLNLCCGNMNWRIIDYEIFWRYTFQIGDTTHGKICLPHHISPTRKLLGLVTILTLLQGYGWAIPTGK
ncbi:hypothetical protein BC332_20872 [Capsicum chinense]|nr:hypothetical protein BC332_20872 [Capsicum chinense]